MNIYKDLTDCEFKILQLIKEWQSAGHKDMLPGEQWIRSKTGKGRTTVFRALAGLRDKGAISG